MIPICGRIGIMLIDTNIYSLAMRGDAEVVDTLRRTRSIGISVISIGELLSGFKAGKKERKNRRELEEFLDSPRVRVYGIDEDCAEFYASILNSLRSVGKPVPTNDLWIASIALRYGLRIYTKDSHFQNIPGIVLYS